MTHADSNVKRQLTVCIRSEILTVALLLRLLFLGIFFSFFDHLMLSSSSMLSILSIEPTNVKLC